MTPSPSSEREGLDQPRAVADHRLPSRSEVPSPHKRRYRIWYHDGFGWVSTDMYSRWRWLAGLRAWEHQKRGWFRYEVRDA